MNKSLLYCFTLSLIINTNLTASGTEPTDTDSDGKREVSTLDHLLWISTNSTAWSYSYEQMNDINASATSSWNGGAGFSPIGNSTTNFTGSYDGQGFTLSNLYINRPSEDYIGFFGVVTGGTISNTNLTSISIYGKYVTGGLVGDSEVGSLIQNCYTSGSIVSGSSAVGGLIGRCDHTVTSSGSTCDVTVISDGLWDYERNFGGFVGWAAEEAIISQCYSTGDVTGWDNVGGFAGQTCGTITNCYTMGNATRNTGSSTDVAAFAGALYGGGTISNSYCTGDVFGGLSTRGFVGYFYSATAENNFFDSEVSNQSTASGATAKTTVEMKTVATFTDETTTGLTTAWDFETNPNDDVANNDYWDMDLSGVTNSGYPFLSWQNGEDTSLPVELASFVVTETRSDAITLEWITESEIENIGFILERRDVLGEDHTEWIELSSYLTEPRLQGQGSVTHRTIYTYRDETVEPGKVYDYRLADVSYSGEKTYHSVTVLGIEVTPVPEKFTLYPVYPNPFNPVTTIEYELVEAGIVTLAVYDIMGRELMSLINHHQPSGLYKMELDATTLSSGEYLLRLTQNDQVSTQKLILLK